MEETQREMEREISPPTRKAAAVAVIENPCAGKYVEDLSELMAIGEELGDLLTQRAVAALGIPGHRQRVMARPLPSAKMENWNMRLRSCIRSSARRFGESSAKARP